MALDPQARSVLDQMAQVGGKPINELSVGEARRNSECLAAMQGPGIVVALKNGCRRPGGGIG
jgi:hypothetical protein